MAGTVLLLVTLLCLSADAACDYSRTDLRGPEEGARQSTVTVTAPADEIRQQERPIWSVNNASSSTQLAAQGLAELLPRMALFSYALNLSIAQCGGGRDCRREQKVNKGLSELIHKMTLFSHALNTSNTQPEGDDEAEGDGEQRVNEALGELVHRMTLFSHALNVSSTQHGGASSDGEQVKEGLGDLVHAMTLLSKALTSDHMQPHATTLPSSLAPTTAAPGDQPCLPPFELIAYRMCILQEMTLKLSWSDAQEFCRERGAELAEDMTVIKTRRFLNDLYGEDGTRSRWPIWVGGRKVGQTWKWRGGLDVPEFLWAHKEPRAYSQDLMPEGVCVILDGYRRFHGASLPCHLRRRFVCQLLD